MPTAEEIRMTAVAHGQAVKRKNALTAAFSGGLPAVILGILFAGHPQRWVTGFLVGLLWANGFEYVYHRFLLHRPASFLGRGHLLHHMSVCTPTEAEHVNFGNSPFWVCVLFVINGAPVVTFDLLFRLGVAPGMFVAFVVYLLAVEEIHWRIHLGGWLPPGLRFAKEHHLAHHERADERFTIFLPLLDWLLGSLKSHTHSTLSHP